MYTRRVRLAALAGLLALMVGLPGQADPLSTRTEDVDVTVIEGSINAGGSGASAYYISYTVTVSRRKGQYLATTTRDPGQTYTAYSACLVLSSRYFSDKGCTSSVKLSQSPEMTSSSGSFTAKMRQAGARVKITFSTKGSGAIVDDPPRYNYAADPAKTSARADAGRWTSRDAKPKGTVAWPGFPKFAIKGDASMSRGTVVAAVVDG